jgi:predicted HD phosphohydrolase
MPSNDILAANYAAQARAIEARHTAQTMATVAELSRKYASPVFGRIPVWEAIEMLGRCVDPTDRRLFGASQHLHVLQIIDAMENEGTASEEFVLAALLHDLGKVLLIAGEVPENVVCRNDPIAAPARGAGLDNCVLQWNHDEFAWSRVRDHVPDPVAWLVRYHSINVAACKQYFDDRDRDYAERYLRLFARYDHGTKSPYNVPQRRLDDYRPVVDRVFPASIPI